MISGLSKAITLYLAPVLALTAIILSLLAYLAPTLLLHDKVALLTVVPSTALIQSNSSQAVDGPSIFLGALGSCAKTSNSASINCTAPSASPQYDLSVLPGNAPHTVLSAPTASTPIFIAVAISFSIFFFVSFTLISLRHKMGKAGGILENPMLQRLSAWVGFFGFLIGLTAFLIIRMWFGKAVEDFNASITSQGQQGPKLIASTGNGFTMVWVAYAFYAVPIITSLTKLNVTKTKA
ncbi:hypothetical protein BYT27DRAFT_7082486 [Phlegmacium glaucopus]|nr:hypothetical protein BYT27DRAFT_7082486 [Phlegmacium glaucopus]